MPTIDSHILAGVNKRRKVGTHLRKKKVKGEDGRVQTITTLCKFKKTATVQALEKYLLKQDVFHTCVSRLHTKKRRGKHQAEMKADGKRLKREHDPVAPKLKEHSHK